MSRGVKRTLGIVVTSLALACASSGEEAASLDRYEVRYRADARGPRYTFNSPPEQIVAALPDVYGFFGFPGSLTSDRNQMLFISPNARAEGRIYNDAANSQYLDCGTAMGATPRADTHVVEFAIITRVVPLETGGSEIEVIIDGTARDRAHNSTAVPCKGTGRLESELATRLRYQLATAPPTP
jgi:hypothetical protein